ncbi:MAG: DUF2207 domain-containing protein, partial [Clostridia bacterium]|nr:DUF2207 domain-containing protein [Clostridia bacterium]
VDQIIKEINSQDNKHKIFEKTPLGMGFLIILMSIIIYMLITINPVLDSYGGILVVPFALILPALGMREFLVSFFGKTSLYTKMKGLLAGIGVGGFSWFLLVFPALKIESLYALSYLIGCVSMLLLFFFYKIMPKRTVYGNELLGKIKGFKTFLKTAKKPKLEILVREDPAYFYNILPYAYVLGVSDKWIKKFESIAVKAPDWYCGNSMFSMSSFSTFMAATVSPDRTAMFLSRLGDGSGGGGGGSW